MVNSPLIGHLSIGAEIRFLVPLIPEVQPVHQQDSGLRLVRRRLFQCIPELRELCRTLQLGFGENIFGDWQAFVIVAHHIPPFPAAIFSQVEAAVAAVSALCHGAISSPR